MTPSTPSTDLLRTLIFGDDVAIYTEAAFDEIKLLLLDAAKAERLARATMSISIPDNCISPADVERLQDEFDAALADYVGYPPEEGS